MKCSSSSWTRAPKDQPSKSYRLDVLNQRIIGAKGEPFKVPLIRNVAIEAPNKYGMGTFLLVPEAEYNLLG